MNERLSISIGIPAFNEQLNIIKLLKAVTEQELLDAEIKEIIVVSDGSTDQTCTLVKNFNHPLVKLIEHQTRMGQQAVQNKILQVFKGDALVIIEADTLPANRNFLAELIKPLLEGNHKQIGMIVGNGIPFTPDNFLEKILYYNSELKHRMFDEWKNGDNVYSSGGHAGRLFTKALTDNLRWPLDVPEDSYAYFMLKKLNLKLVKQQNALLIARNVRNLSDRMKQGSKFANGKQALLKHFKAQEVKSEFSIPASIIFKQTALGFLRHPVWTVLAMIEFLIIRILAFSFRKDFNALYIPYTSSKDLKEKHG